MLAAYWRQEVISKAQRELLCVMKSICASKKKWLCKWTLVIDQEKYLEEKMLEIKLLEESWCKGTILDDIWAEQLVSY